MKFKPLALVFMLIFLPLTGAASTSLLSVSVLNETIPALPWSTVVVPFEVTNLGNETLTNVTVYVTGPAEGFQYSVKVIKTPIAPGKSLRDRITLRVLNPYAGTYEMFLIARAGNFYANSTFRVRVEKVVDYSLSIDAEGKYVCGHPVRVRLSVRSLSNVLITGRIGYIVEEAGKPLVNETVVTFVRPGAEWVRGLEWKSLPTGNYTVYLWANLSGVYKSKRASFEVYQRSLNYTVVFRNGAIEVRVYNSSGGVPGIPVEINGIRFATGPDGTVAYAVSSPGRYVIVLRLDCRVVRTSVEVKKLIVSPEVEGGALLVKVMDSTGLPASNVTVIASGPLGTDYSVTNASGIAVVNLTKTGYGSIFVRAESERYLPGEVEITVPKPSPRPSTSTVPSNTTFQPPESPTETREVGNSWVWLVLLLAGLFLAGTSYLAFAVPVVHEETLDRYYFVKVRAPRLRPLKNYRLERQVKAIKVRATKGNAKLEDGKLVWELDLEPGEEAYLQAVLG